jgi:hypothetical protein
VPNLREAYCPCSIAEADSLAVPKPAASAVVESQRYSRSRIATGVLAAADLGTAVEPVKEAADQAAAQAVGWL